MLSAFVVTILAALLPPPYLSNHDGSEIHRQDGRISESDASFLTTAFADGLAFEVLPPATLGDRQVSLFERIDPPILRADSSSNVTMDFRLFEPTTNQTYQNTTYYLRVYKLVDGTEEPILVDSFYSYNGPLRLHIIPTDGFLEVDAEREPYFNAYIAKIEDDSVKYKTPIILDGGLYHVRVTIFTLEKQGEVFDEQDAPTFDSWLSIGSEAARLVQIGGQDYNLRVISFYDVLNEINFDESKNMISWSMPFNWDIDKLKAAQNVFIHQEVKIPRLLVGIGDATSFTATVSGKPISGRMLAIDPYSSEQDLIVHYLLNKNDIIDMVEKASGNTLAMAFTLAPGSAADTRTTSDMVTDTGGIEIAVEWKPDQLSADTESTVELAFSGAFSGSRISSDVIYDLKILDSSGNEVYSKTEQTAEGGTATQAIDFPADENYHIEVMVKGLVKEGQSIDETINGIARGAVVVPEFQVSILVVVLSMVVAIILIISRLQFRIRY